MGVLQGEVCPPAIFSLFINDLPEYLSDDSLGVQVVDILIKILMFADDMAIFSTTREGLQTGLNNLHSYCRKWGITVNTEKTKIVVFRKGGKLSKDDKWSFNGYNIQVVNIFKYLGCHLSTQCTFKTHIDKAVESARKGLFLLKQYISTNPEILPKSQLEIFDTMIKPILTYGSEVWGLYNLNSIETFYLSFLKSILFVKKSTPNCYIYGDFGVYPLEIEIKMGVVKYWLKIIRPKTSHDNYVRKIYLQLLFLNITNPNQITWVSQVKDMFNSMGLGFIWNRQKVSNETQFLKIFRQRLEDMYKQEWHAQVSRTTDGRIYKSIKDTFEFENYLQLPKHLRIAISKIRMSSHLFYIERGRWYNIKRIERVCNLCQEIEDEYHLAINCPRFCNELKCYLPTYLKESPNVFKFIKFLKSKDESQIKQLGYLCYKLHKEYKKELLSI